MIDKRPLDIPALLADLAHVRLPGPELYLPARDGKITLPNGKRRRLVRQGKYLAVWYNNKARLHHRVVAELVLGVTLSRRLHIHHVNGNRHDNRPENLFPMDERQHLRLEKTHRSLFGVCTACGQVYELPRSRSKKTKQCFCGEQCRQRYLVMVWGPLARQIARSHERGHSRAEIDRARRDPSARWRGWL